MEEAARDAFDYSQLVLVAVAAAGAIVAAFAGIWSAREARRAVGAAVDAAKASERQARVSERSVTPVLALSVDEGSLRENTWRTITLTNVGTGRALAVHVTLRLALVSDHPEVPPDAETVAEDSFTVPAIESDDSVKWACETVADWGAFRYGTVLIGPNATLSATSAMTLPAIQPPAEFEITVRATALSVIGTDDTRAEEVATWTDITY